MRHAASAIGCATAALWTALAGNLQAAEIHKCTDGGAIAYQTTPCGAAQTEVAVLKTRDASPRTEPEEPIAARIRPGARDDVVAFSRASTARGARWLPFRRAAIVPGMTDDEVLNTPNGGVPTKISRSREGRTWRERWTYALRDGTLRELEFVNGTLTNIVDDVDAAPSLRLAVAQ